MALQAVSEEDFSVVTRMILISLEEMVFVVATLISLL